MAKPRKTGSRAPSVALAVIDAKPSADAVTAVVMQRAQSATEYNAVVDSAVLLEVRLIHSAFELQPSYDESARDQRDLGFGGELREFKLDEKTGVARGYFSWWIEGTVAKKPVVTLSTAYVIAYAGLAGRDKDAVRRFIDRVGRFAVFPYFRALASQFSWAADLNLPPLPILKQDNATPSPRKSTPRRKVGGKSSSRA